MKTKSLGVLALLTLMGLLVSCGKTNRDTKSAEADNGSQVVEVTTEKVVKAQINRVLTYPATIQAFKENHLAPATAGRVERILVDIGDKVYAGQVVAELDRSTYYQAKIQFDKLALDLQRMDSLLRVGAIARQQYDAVKMQYDVAKTNMEFLRDNTVLRSPIAGEITGKYLNDGEMFTMAPAAGIGKPAIVSIMQLDRLKLLVGISSEYFSQIKLGMPVSITTDIYPGKEFKGKIGKIYPTVDEMTKNFTVEIYLDNPGKMLRPGMFAKASISLGMDEAILVPAFIVQKQPGTAERFVFIHENGVARRRVVELGDVFDDKVEIRKGLAEGDEIVVTGQTRLHDGVQIQLVSAN
ncbi:MAG: rane fusion protein multidrug efflux system [Bacteroidales bacterium]|jgi:RND family efflux transporter MFP subunit|nr:rane fusion protein multidrug efflux system [Bacteroidales bacterium]MDN5329521.1 rane fusion protein multidrug efflux system [Bacteroidales bacterium]